jgi:hypothetical protein
MIKHNEDTRVKLPAILHLTRLGYNYISLKNAVWDEQKQGSEKQKSRGLELNFKFQSSILS